MTAGAFNTAVQNALDTEFVCIERQNGNGGCLLYKIRSATQNQSPNLLCRYSRLGTCAAFDAATGITTNTVADTKDYILLRATLMETYQTVYSDIERVLPEEHVNNPTIKKVTFTTPENAHHIRIVVQVHGCDAGVWFPLEPLTTYTLIVRVLEVNPRVIGGDKVQMMMVQGEYNSDAFIPCGNVYMPTSD